jgi:hypothetical protein
MLPFFGMVLTSAHRVNLSNQTINANGATPTNVTAGYRLGTDGKEYRAQTQTAGGAYQQIAGIEWLDPHDATEADGYECFATLVSGAITSGTTGSWLPLSSNRDWEVTRTNDALGTDSAQITIQIRRVGTTVVLDSGVITLNAEVT